MLIDLSIDSERVHVPYLISSLSDAKSRVKAAAGYGSRKLNHSIEGDCNGSWLNDTVSAILRANKDLTQNAHTVKEGAPKLQKEYFEPIVIRVTQTTITRIKGTEEGWLSYSEVAKNDPEVSTKDLEAKNHKNQLQVSK